jgi:cytochrome c oxidase subunit 3
LLFFGLLLPLLNTPSLPSSGAAVTWAHHAILAGKEKRAVYALVATVLLALVSTGFQGMEYYQAPSTISDSIYGSTFFLATGFHGFHVIIGTLFLIVCGIRQYLGHLTKKHHVGFEAAAWYWHFVDVVRLFPFVSIYWWGGIWKKGTNKWIEEWKLEDKENWVALIEWNPI